MTEQAAMNHEPGIRDFMPGFEAAPEGIARAGEPRPAGTPVATEAIRWVA